MGQTCRNKIIRFGHMTAYSMQPINPNKLACDKFARYKMFLEYVPIIVIVECDVYDQYNDTFEKESAVHCIMSFTPTPHL